MLTIDYRYQTRGTEYVVQNKQSSSPKTKPKSEIVFFFYLKIGKLKSKFMIC